MTKNRGFLKDNRHGFVGVNIRPNGKFVARIKAYSKRMYVGIYATVEEAARGYDEAMIELHGNNAVTNEKLGNFRALDVK